MLELQENPQKERVLVEAIIILVIGAVETVFGFYAPIGGLEFFIDIFFGVMLMIAGGQGVKATKGTTVNTAALPCYLSLIKFMGLLIYINYGLLIFGTTVLILNFPGCDENKSAQCGDDKAAAIVLIIALCIVNLFMFLLTLLFVLARNDAMQLTKKSMNPRLPN